jgi:plastocyanin
VARPDPGTVEVQIVDFAFVPATLIVPVGTTVRWTNTGVEHTTTSRDNVWGSEVLERGETFSFRFTQPGTYPYICGLHPDMTAVVIVQ